MKRTKHPSALFIRWFWLVYLPLGLLSAGVLLMIFRVLPASMKWPLLLLGGYGLLAVRLLIERKRKGLSVPPPRNIVIGILSVAGLLVLGAILFVLGMGRLTTTEGLVLAGVGGFLMILSVTVPTFRLVDAALRFGSKKISRKPSG
ncbi:MAG TPA: hypothetical protein VNA87_07035 [Actinomycetota bacterium]|nr:hypothetical protein [Actinomycetota bacterium]